MEPDMIVGMLKDLEKDHIHPHELVMDDDSTTISRARKECEQSITKFSDRNHLKKTFSNKLYDLQRFKKYQQLRGKTMTHLKKCFSYVLAQNQKKPEELKKSLLCIIPHMYGDHLACPSWCKYKRNPASYLPRNLPYSRYLTCPELKKDLEAIIQTYAQQADKLSDLGSTQACESFNHIVASKNPKSLFLSGSESTSFRIAAAVAQKNIGKSYIQEVNDELNMSPGAYTEKAVEKMDRKRKLQKIRQSSAEYKKRRCQIRKSSSQDQGCKEVREGKTYETSVGLEKMDEEQDINSIPSATVEPERIPLRNTDSTFVYFDLETTGLGSSAEILEIGAARGQDIFQKYIKPNGTISANATCVTGLHMKNHELYYRDQKLATTDLKSALQKFSEWLSDSNSNILVSHNGLRFDFPLFIQNIMSQNIVMNTCIAGFIDTLEVFKNSDLKTQTGSFSQESLMRDAGIQSTGVSHCALTDAMDLQNLVNFHNIPFNTLLSQSVMYDYVLQHLKFSSVKNDNLKSLDVLVHGKVITEFMANKIAKSGLNMNYIKLAHTRNGEDGVKNLFQEIVNGKARVTKCKKIINSVFNYLSSQL
ncbi:uncharacterized protein LOC134232509 [Saccostrea cucullata]|uniref:uncharacterized protein LOC134232509 n=1 Tax=Saccostrea cuccullata TaxID=36930 RepID=UPI002ED6647A